MAKCKCIFITILIMIFTIYICFILCLNIIICKFITVIIKRRFVDRWRRWCYTVAVDCLFIWNESICIAQVKSFINRAFMSLPRFFCDFYIDQLSNHKTVCITNYLLSIYIVDNHLYIRYIYLMIHHLVLHQLSSND